MLSLLYKNDDDIYIIRSDFLSFGMKLEDITLQEFYSYLLYPPVNSHLANILTPETGYNSEFALLRDIVYFTWLNTWTKSKDASNGKKPPEKPLYNFEIEQYEEYKKKKELEHQRMQNQIQKQIEEHFKKQEIENRKV